MTSARRRVLVVAPFAPRIDGRSGGEKVMARTVMALADGHEVGVVYLRGPGEGDADLPAGRFPIVRAVDRPWALDAPGRWIRQWRLAAGLAGGTPLWPGRWWSPACAAAIRETVESWQPEIVQFEYHVMGQYADAIGDGPGASSWITIPAKQLHARRRHPRAAPPPSRRPPTSVPGASTSDV